jgi:hypothetical protein
MAIDDADFSSSQLRVFVMDAMLDGKLLNVRKL